MMLTELYLGNFKAFADTQRMPIRPLTLIFGPNSAGKSSLIHGLLFAHHAEKNGELDVVFPELGGGTVDLGGFRQFVHGGTRGLANPLVWGAGCRAEQVRQSLDSKRSVLYSRFGYESKDWATILKDSESLSIELLLRMPLDNLGKPVADGVPQIEGFEFLIDGSVVLDATVRSQGWLGVNQIDLEHPTIRGMINLIIANETLTTSVGDDELRILCKEVDAVVPELMVICEKFLPTSIQHGEAIARTGGETVGDHLRGTGLDNKIKVVTQHLPRMLNELIQGISEIVRENLGNLWYLGPLRSYPPRHVGFVQPDTHSWVAGGGYAWEILLQNEPVRNVVNEWLGSEERLQTPYELVVRTLLPDTILNTDLAPRISIVLWRFLAESLSGSSEMSESFVDYMQSLRNRLAHGEIGKEMEDIPPDVEEMIASLVDSEEVSERWVREMVQANADLFPDLVLLDKRTETPVTHRDVGIGISQVLPVLVYSYAFSNKIIAMEQPEIHLHPKLQAELGDVFIGSALGERRNTFILETHSEHLILRILRRIRETTQKKGECAVPIRPEDVALLYVGGDRTGSSVRELRVDEHGRLLDRCPGGFFEEDFEELF